MKKIDLDTVLQKKGREVAELEQMERVRVSIRMRVVEVLSAVNRELFLKGAYLSFTETQQKGGYTERIVALSWKPNTSEELLLVCKIRKHDVIIEACKLHPFYVHTPVEIQLRHLIPIRWNTLLLPFGNNGLDRSELAEAIAVVLNRIPKEKLVILGK